MMYDPGGIRGISVDGDHRCDPPHSSAAPRGITSKDMNPASEFGPFLAQIVAAWNNRLGYAARTDWVKEENGYEGERSFARGT